jgi:hypothetical protein
MYLQGKDLEELTSTSLSSVILSARKMDTLCDAFQNVFRTSMLVKNMIVITQFLFAPHCFINPWLHKDSSVFYYRITSPAQAF